MARASLVPCSLAACLTCLALVAGGAACESTVNLGNGADGSAPDVARDDAADNPQDGAPDGAAPTCESLCDQLVVTCGLASDQRDACVVDCQQKLRPSDRACIAQTPCVDVATKCAGIGGFGPLPDGSVPNPIEVIDCQDSCNTSHFHDCINASELSTCRALCASGPPAKGNTYNACQSGAGVNCAKAHDCFDAFTM